MKLLNKNTFMLCGVEITAIPKKERKIWEAKIVKHRADLIIESGKGFEDYFELNDGSILQITTFAPKEWLLRLYHSDTDLLKFRFKLDENHEKLKKYNYKTDYEIINIREEEINSLNANNAVTLADSLKININLLDYSKQSLSLLNKTFMRVVAPEEKDNNPVFKALLFYLAQVILREIDGKIDLKIKNGIVANILIKNEKGQSFDAILTLPEI